ncbi:MAG: hypothetical protein IT381_10460 [Deltaproteobacteria bacterium]|nr:hypothetical protein [Deltaproteobacteria bacterium]
MQEPHDDQATKDPNVCSGTSPPDGQAVLTTLNPPSTHRHDAVHGDHQAHDLPRVFVTERALIQRLNRRLAQVGWHGMSLKKTRSARAFMDLGEFYIVDHENNFVVDRHVDIEEEARELGVLRDWEALAPAAVGGVS